MAQRKLAAYITKMPKDFITLKPVERSCPRQSARTSYRLPLICVLMTSVVILSLGLIPQSQAQTLLPPEPQSQGAGTQPPSLSSLVAKGRQHPSYQVFAAQLSLPAMTVLDKTTLDVGGKLKMDVSRMDQSTQDQKENLSSQFEVPVDMIDKFLAGCTNDASADAAQVSVKIRVMVIDYRYLLKMWTRYNPPSGQEQVKADAMSSLQAGNLDEAWKKFVALPRPKPPTQVRVMDPQFVSKIAAGN